MRPQVGLTLLLSLWLYLALLICTCLKLINHFGDIKDSKESVGAVLGEIRQGQVKEFLKFSWHAILIHIHRPPSADSCPCVCVCVVCVTGVGEDLLCHSNSLELHLYQCH